MAKRTRTSRTPREAVIAGVYQTAQGRSLNRELTDLRVEMSLASTARSSSPPPDPCPEVIQELSAGELDSVPGGGYCHHRRTAWRCGADGPGLHGRHS